MHSLLIKSIHKLRILKSITNHHYRCIIVAGLFMMLPSIALSQALVDGFFRGAGQADVTVSYTYERGDSFWLGQDKMDLPPFYNEITRNSVSLYVAYGLTDNIDINLNLPYLSVNGDGEGPSDQIPPQSFNNIQDGELTFKWRPVRAAMGPGAFSLVAAGALSIPLSNYQNGEFPDAASERPILVALGDRTTEISGALLAQYKFFSGLFTSIQGGYTLKGKSGDNNIDVPNAAIISGKIGYGSGSYYGAISLSGQFSTDGSDIGTGPFPNHQVDYTRLGFTGSYSILTNLSANLGYVTTLDGRNALDSNALSVGLTFKLGH